MSEKPTNPIRRPSRVMTCGRAALVHDRPDAVAEVDVAECRQRDRAGPDGDRGRRHAIGGEAQAVSRPERHRVIAQPQRSVGAGGPLLDRDPAVAADQALQFDNGSRPGTVAGEGDRNARGANRWAAQPQGRVGDGDWRGHGLRGGGRGARQRDDDGELRCEAGATSQPRKARHVTASR